MATYIFYYEFSCTTYIFDAIKDKENVKCVEMPRERGLRHSVLSWNRHLKFTLYTPIAHYKEIMKIVNEVKPEDTVILFDYDTYDNVKYLLKKIRSKTIHIWFWNTIDYKRARILGIDSGKELIFHTFDAKDAKKFGFLLNNQVYRYPENYGKDDSATPKPYDFFFIGLTKGRVGIMRELNAKLKKWGYTTKFLLIDRYGKDEEIDGVELSSKERLYNETLHYIEQSKVLVDCTKADQEGVTLRVLEGLFMGKKILSNNPKIKEQPFYDKSRILLFDELTSAEVLAEFMNTPFKALSEEELKPYEINQWLNDFLSPTESGQ